MVELTGKSNGTLAQVVEQWTENPCVLGSTPRGTTQQRPAHPSGSLLLIPIACSFFGIGNDVAMQAVAVGVIVGVIQNSVETALNSSGDVFFTATARVRQEEKGKKE